MLSFYRAYEINADIGCYVRQSDWCKRLTSNTSDRISVEVVYEIYTKVVTGN
jgi:hypothetical protein